MAATALDDDHDDRDIDELHEKAERLAEKYDNPYAEAMAIAFRRIQS